VILVYWKYSKDQCTNNPVNMWLILLYILHYVNRSILFGLKIQNPKPIPIAIFTMTSSFCAINGWLQANWLLRFQEYDADWIYSVQFVAGNILFFLGMYINQKSDKMLINLRKPGDSGYKIPQGFLFEYISAPNFAGEIIEWIGFGLASSTAPGYFFAFSTTLNIGPRMYHHHRWYQDKFDDYPKSRKAIIPFIF